AFDPDALADPNRYEWQNGRSLLSSLVGNGFWHPESHTAQCYIDRGDLPRATRMQEALTEHLAQYGDQLAPRGEALYNLVCFYAVNGQPDQALAILPEALLRQPDLVEWSKEDADLVSLHDLPAYQALYESYGMAAATVERRVYSVSSHQLFGVCVTVLGQLRATIERHNVERGRIVAALGAGLLAPISELSLVLRPLGAGQTELL